MQITYSSLEIFFDFLRLGTNYEKNFLTKKGNYIGWKIGPVSKNVVGWIQYSVLSPATHNTHIQLLTLTFKSQNRKNNSLKRYYPVLSRFRQNYPTLSGIVAYLGHHLRVRD